MHVSNSPEATTIRATRRVTYKASKPALRLVATTSNAALSAAIAALVAACETEEPLALAHTAAERAAQEASNSNAGDDVLARAEAAEEAAERRWHKARRAVDRAADALLKVQVDSAADALLQQKAYAWSYEARNITDIWGEEEQAASLRAAQRALQRLAAKAPLPPGGRSGASADAALVQAAEQYDALDRAAMDSADYRVADAFITQMQAPIDLIVATPATSLEGLAAKARVAEHYQPGEDFNEYEDLEWRVHRSLTRDVLAIAGAATPAESAGARAWRAARERYYAAKAARDADVDRADELVEGAPLLSAVCDAMEAWESLPPPNLQALAEVMRASLDFNGFTWEFQGMDGRSLRDLLDSGRTHSIFAARYFLHVLRLAGGSDREGLLSTVPIATLCPSFEITPDDDDIARSWATFHASARPHDTRRHELVNWWRAVLGDPTLREQQDISGADNCQAAFDAARPQAAQLERAS